MARCVALELAVCVSSALVPASAQQSDLSVNVELAPPGATAALPSLADRPLVLPHPIGSASFSVATRNAGVSGAVTVLADTSPVPLPVTVLVCQADSGTGACVSAPAAMLGLTLGTGQAPRINVFVDALAPIPLDREHHRVHVRFADAAGVVVGAAIVAIHNTSYSRQIAIHKGGTYSGSWNNDHIQTGEPGAGGNVVFIDTTEPVTLENCFLSSTRGHLRTVPGANVTVRNCNAYGSRPAEPGATPGFFLFGPDIGGLTMENNYLEGMAWGAALWSGTLGRRWTPSGPIVIRYNRVRNLDKQPGDGLGGRVTAGNPNTGQGGFVSVMELDLLHGAEIAWNEVIAEPYVSATNDIVNLWSAASTAATPISVHDNYFRGQYAPTPEAGNGVNLPDCQPWQPMCYGTYVAQVIVLDGHHDGETAQTATSFVRIHDNQLVNTWGGITLTAGHDNQAYGNRVVSTGRLRNGHWVAPAYSGGLTVADYYGMGPGVFYNNSAHDNVVGFVLQRVSPTDPLVYVPPPIRSDYLFTHSGCAGADAALCFNNQSLPDPITFETEDNEAVLWRQKLAAQRVRVGPSLSADCLFDWAQQRYADLLPPAGAVTRVWSTYLYRHYPQTGTYVGVDTRDDHVYYLGPTTAGQLMDLGAAADWLRTASCR